MNPNEATRKNVTRNSNDWPREPIEGTLGMVIRQLTQQIVSKQVKLIQSNVSIDQQKANSIDHLRNYISSVQNNHYDKKKLEEIVIPYANGQAINGVLQVHVSDVNIPVSEMSKVCNSIIDLYEQHLLSDELKITYTKRINHLRTIMKEIGY